ncbi:MAG TPA: SRPBCC domain-containing protein, partial [candidate division Zixibacteria bacterium]|nr:SRPBCC domain-containing protein [candidate division Zixibacteria bacterium]
MKAKVKKLRGKNAGEREPYGVVTGPGEIRIERLLPGPVERIWAYLTESEKRGKWFAAGQMELRKGGRLELIFHNSQLSRHDEPTPEKYQKCEGYKSTGEIMHCQP